MCFEFYWASLLAPASACTRPAKSRHRCMARWRQSTCPHPPCPPSSAFPKSPWQWRPMWQIMNQRDSTDQRYAFLRGSSMSYIHINEEKTLLNNLRGLWMHNSHNQTQSPPWFCLLARLVMHFARHWLAVDIILPKKCTFLYLPEKMWQSFQMFSYPVMFLKIDIYLLRKYPLCCTLVVNKYLNEHLRNYDLTNTFLISHKKACFI